MTPKSMAAFLVSNRVLLAWVIVFCIVGQVGRELWTPDEPRVAAIAASMAQSHDWIVPDFAGIPFIEKPPLGFALYAAGSELVGPLVGAVSAMRIVNIVLALGTLWLTFALGRRLYDDQLGVRAAIILGTMLGFAANAHWLRVDFALTFFVLLAIYAFTEVMLAGRGAFAWLGGVATACAFLTKGVVGPGIIFLAWLPLVIHAWRQPPQNGSRRSLIIAQLIALLCFAFLAVGWVVALRLHANGEALWQTWFWVNQIGRATGHAAKGHMHPHEFLYYPVQVMQYGFPWFLLPFAWTWRWFRRDRRGIGARMLATWVLGTLLILTLAAGKRSIYMLPVLPGLALMTAQQIEGRSTAVRWWAAAVLVLTAAGALLLASSPLLISHFADKVPQNVYAIASQPGLSTLAGMLIACGAAFVAWKSGYLNDYRLTALSGIAVLSLIFFQLMPLAATAKSMRGAIDAFSAEIPAAERPRIASVNLQETERGLLRVYAHWSLTAPADNQQIQAILRGDDAQFDSLLVNQRNAEVQLGDLIGAKSDAYCVLAKTHPRDDGSSEALFWVAGRQTRLCAGRR